MRSAGTTTGRNLRAVLLLSGAALSFSCASPAQKILTSANGYNYWSARVKERCPSPTETLCKEASVLARWYTALVEANEALQRGGKLPLQLDALKQSEKEARKWQR